MKFSVCDTHCDTVSRILDEKQSLYENDGQLDINRLKEQNFIMQYFAAWIEPKYANRGFERANIILDKFYEEKPNDLVVIKTAEDIDESRLCALLSIEGGEAIEGDLNKLKALHDRGVRAMTLTWNGANQIADGVQVDNAKGLTAFGHIIVREMNRMGMIIDVSHIAERGFWDVAEYTKAPFIASHSNAKAVCGHVRNLSDDQIKAIVDRNGFIGINLYPGFLSEKEAGINDILRHIEYFLSLNSQDVIGFGADFDGVDSLPKGIAGVQDMYKIIDEMLRIGYSDELVNKILMGNAIRATKEILNFL